MGKALDFARRGRRSEYLAQFAFNAVGFVVPVPRQEDLFLTDFFVHLSMSAGEGANRGDVPLGHAFAVQVKSSDAPVVLKAEDAKLLTTSQLPWFLAVCSKDRTRLRVFSTSDRHWYKRWREPLTISFDTRPETLDEPNPDAMWVRADLKWPGFRGA